MTIEDMRKTYTKAGLDEKDIQSDPMVQFQMWFRQAEQSDLPSWLEINAMTLSTSDLDGNVTSRIVLLKGIDDGKFQFFTNYDSAKGKQITANAKVSLCFYWPHVERQVRIEGVAQKTDRKRSVDYFQSRPRGSQLGAHVSQQSHVIENRDVMQASMARLEEKYQNEEIQCPDNWGGYQVEPAKFEFWQGRPSRLHDRLCYQSCDNGWQLVRLSP
jgi:pyridoxamine 5'-phosphate oxidase